MPKKKIMYREEFVSGLIDEIYYLRGQLKMYKPDAVISAEELTEKAHAEEIKAREKTIGDLKKEISDLHEELRDTRQHLNEVIEDILNDAKNEKTKADNSINALTSQLKDLEKHCRELEDKITELEEMTKNLEDRNEVLLDELENLKIQIGANSKTSSFTSLYDRTVLAPIEKELENEDIEDEAILIGTYNDRKYSDIENAGSNPTDKADTGAKKDDAESVKKRKSREPVKAKELLVPDETIVLDIPEFENNPRYIKLEDKEVRQVVEIVTHRKVTNYAASCYMDKQTGMVVHADFPDNVNSKINYGERMKTTVFMDTCVLNASMQKTQDVINEMTGGAAPSAGFISQMTREFAAKAEPEYNQIKNGVSSHSYMHGDFSFMNMNKKNMPILILMSNGLAYFQVRDSRGIKGLEGTPLDGYKGILISDGEAAFARYEGKNQQCWAHVIRYLNASIVNEPKLTWARKMKIWAKKAIHYRNDVKRMGADFNDTVVEKLEKEYDEILELAGREYEANPPRKYFTNGYALYKRLCDKDRFILFLHDIRIEPTNNCCEREARQLKRKLAECMCFRSREALEDYCKCLSVIETWKLAGENIYEKIMEVFARPNPHKRGRPNKEVVDNIDAEAL